MPSLASEQLERRSMLAVSVSVLPGGVLFIDQDNTTTDAQIELVLSNGSVTGIDPVTFLPTQKLADGITVSSVSSTFYPFVNPWTGDAITAITIDQEQAVTLVKVTDQLGVVTDAQGIVAAGQWEVDFQVAGVGSQTISILNTPSRLLVNSGNAVTLSGDFGTGQVSLEANGVVVGTSGGPGVTGGVVSLNPAVKGSGTVSFVESLTATTSLVITSNAAVTFAQDVRSNQMTFDLRAGGTQTGGLVTAIGATPKFTLTAGGDVDFSNTANVLGEIQAINAAGRSITLGSSDPVTQVAAGSITAASLKVESLGAVILGNSSNDVTNLAISAGGTVVFQDKNAVTLGVGGLGIAAPVGSPVTITTKGNLTQATDGAVVADTFTVNILAPAAGSANLNLNSVNNQVLAFQAENKSAGGGITLVNTPNTAPLTIAPLGVKAVNGPISITNGTGLEIDGVIYSAPAVGTPTGSVSLSAVGAINQTAAITAQSLTVTNGGSTGGIVLDVVTNNVQNVSIRNDSTGVGNGIRFKGSNGALGRLAIGVGGVGITTSKGDIVVDTAGQPLAINAPIKVVGGGDVDLTTTNGITQLAGAGITANQLAVTNLTGGAVVLSSPANDVASLVIDNSNGGLNVLGSVQYVDVNELTLGSGGGIVATGAVALTVGGAFTSTAGNPITTTAGTVTVNAVGATTLGAPVTAAAGVAVTAGNATTTSGLAVNAAIFGGAAGSVSLSATGSLTSSAAGTVLATADAVLAGQAGVTLNAAVTAGGAVSVTSTKGGLATVGAAALTANGGGVTVTTAADATFGNSVTATGAISVKAGTAPTLASIAVNGAFTAGAAVGLTATNDVTTTKAVQGTGVTIDAGDDVTLGGLVKATAGPVAIVAGGDFASTSAAADISATAAVAVTSGGGMTLVGGATGTTVTLGAGGGVAIKDAVVATAGDLDITTGGGLTTSAGGTLTAAGSVVATAATGITLTTAVAGAVGVDLGVTGGPITFNAGGSLSTPAGTATLAAAGGVVQNSLAAGDTIVADALVVSNTGTGAITLANPANNVESFRATNTVAGGQIKFVDVGGLVLTAPGTSTNNGIITITTTGAIDVAGPLSSGTANTTLTAAGPVSQATTAAITANRLGVFTTTGDILLNKAANSVAVIHGANTAVGGQFAFSDTSALQIGVANELDLTTNDGTISIAAGTGGTGALLIAANTLTSGDADIILQAKGGISDQNNVVITIADGPGTLVLKNDVSGNITLVSTLSSFPNVSAVSVAGSTISINDASDVNITGNGYVASGGTLVLNSTGSITQDAKVVGKDATFLATGDVTLEVPTNNVTNLAIDTLGDISYLDFDDFAVGVGGTGVVTVGADISLVSALGGIALNANVSTGTSLPDITRTTLLANNGAILQNAGFVLSGDLVMEAAAGPITMQQPDNDIANLNALAAGSIAFLDRNDFEVGLNAVPIASFGVVSVVAGTATFTDSEANNPLPFDPPLTDGDVIIIGGVPYRLTNFDLATLTGTLVAGDGSLLTTPGAVAFDFLRAQGTEVIAGGDLTLTAGPTVSPPAPTGLLRVTAGMAWAGSLTLSAGTASRTGFVDFVTSSIVDGAIGGTIREMIGYANANGATQVINGATRAQPMRMVFDEANYPVLDVVLDAQLPLIVKPLDFNGTIVEGTVTTQRVGIDGSAIAATSVVNGLRYGLGSNDSRIEGLAVYGFATGAGIQLRSAVNSVTNTYAGILRDGTTLVGNKIGIELTGQTSTKNTIGTITVDESVANVVGGNTYAGVLMRSGASANAIVGNYIGTNSVLDDLGNLGDGIVLDAVNGNIIGTRNAVRPDGTAAASNVIANNNNNGVRIQGARAATLALGNLIENNTIDANAVNGIDIIESTFQSVGGTQARQPNVITSQVTGSGVRVLDSADISITANYIGVDDVGTATLGNAAAGVLVARSARTVINAGNTIGSNGSGVRIRGGSTATRVEGNFIGTNEAGNNLGNTDDGVWIDRSIGNFVRLGNTIANNGASGVAITDSTAATLATGNVVAGNDISGNFDGVRVVGGARHTIGGVGVGNMIVSNAGAGISLERSSQTGASTGLAIQGNYVGTDRNEEIDPALGNGVGIRLSRAASVRIDGRNVVANNVEHGIEIDASSKTTVGTAAAEGGNLITQNGQFGVAITAAGGAVNAASRVYGNEITGNVEGGIVVRGSTSAGGVSTTSDVVIGTSAIPGLTVAGRGNVITENGFGTAGPAVLVDGAQSVVVEGNSIYGNEGLAIEIVNNGNLGAVTPQLTSAVLTQKSGSTPQIVVQGTIAVASTTASGLITRVFNGVATFTVPQSLDVGSRIEINGVLYTVSEVVSPTRVRLTGSPTIATAGSGRVAVRNGQASFSAPQPQSLVGQTLVVAGRLYRVLSLAANGRTGTLANQPTFPVSDFSVLQKDLTFSFPLGSSLDQQYVVDLYLNDPGDGNPVNGTGYQMRTFLGRTTVTVGSNGQGAFTATVNMPSGTVPIGQFITATATTIRSKPGTGSPFTSVSPFSTSRVSTVARQLQLAGPGTLGTS